LNLKYVELLSNSTFNFNMRLYAQALLRRTFQQNKTDAAEAGPRYEAQDCVT